MARDESETLRRVIVRKCVYCCGGSTKEAARCTSEDCPLWPYRPQVIRRKPRKKDAVQITMRMVFEAKGGARW